MNLKKFISGVSAFAIAAGAFAGMAVTANADTTYDTLGSWSYTNVSNRVTGSATVVDDYTTITINGITTYNGVYHGSVHKGSANGGASAAATRASGTRVATQDIRFHHDSGSNIAEYIGATSKSGTNYRGMSSIATFSYAASGAESDSTGTLTLKAGSTSDTVSVTEGAWYTLTVTAEYDSSNAAVTVALANDQGTTVKTVTGTATNYELDTLAVSTPNKEATTSYFDSKNESIGTVAPAAGTVTVSLTDGNGTSLASDIVYDVSDKQIGDSFTYYYPAYIDRNGTLYKSDANAYGIRVSLLTTADTYEATYTAQSCSVYQFKDFDATSVEGVSGVTATSFSNGKLTGGSSGQQLSVFTIAEDGVYTAVVNAGCIVADNQRTGGFYVNGAQKESVIYTNYGGTVNTFEGIALEAGDVITVSIGRGGYNGLDYVLLYKTGELAETGAVTALGTYTTDEGDFAKAFTFTVTPNAETITSITVSDGTTSKSKDNLSLSGSGSVTFGILVTAADAANLDKTFTVTLN